MTKGKYAAKAQNRIVNLDNELLQQAQTRISELEAELDRERLATQEAQRLTAAFALRMSKDAVAVANRNAADKVAEAKSDRDAWGIKLAECYTSTFEGVRKELVRQGINIDGLEIIPRNLVDVLDEITGNRSGDYIPRILEGYVANNRAARRWNGSKSKSVNPERGGEDEKYSVIHKATREVDDVEEP